MVKRFDIQEILKDEKLRKDLIVNSIIFIQAVEGRNLNKKSAEKIYDKIQKGKGE